LIKNVKTMVVGKENKSSILEIMSLTADKVLEKEDATVVENIFSDLSK
jgi:hypothetical protein